MSGTPRRGTPAVETLVKIALAAVAVLLVALIVGWIAWLLTPVFLLGAAVVVILWLLVRL